jgi:phage protein D
MSALSQFAATTAPAVRRPAFELSLGDGSADGLARAVVSIELEAGTAPGVDALVTVLASGADAPAVAVGDKCSVSLGYEGELEKVFSGAVASVRRSVDGPTRVLATNAGAGLARMRVNQSYEQLSAGEIVNELASRFGVEPGAVEDGVQLPFYVVDDRRSVWAHLAVLARACGYLTFADPEGRIVFGPPPAGPPTQSFAYAVDVLSLAAAGSTASVGAVTIVGEGAAGSQGADAAAWFAKDAAGVTGTAGSGVPERLFQEPSLRTGEAAQTAADAAARTPALTGRVVVPGAPGVTVGGAIEITGTPGDTLNGICTVRALRHRYAKRAGFVTTIDFARRA